MRTHVRRTTFSSSFAFFSRSWARRAASRSSLLVTRFLSNTSLYNEMILSCSGQRSGVRMAPEMHLAPLTLSARQPGGRRRIHVIRRLVKRRAGSISSASRPPGRERRILQNTNHSDSILMISILEDSETEPDLEAFDKERTLPGYSGARRRKVLQPRILQNTNHEYTITMIRILEDSRL